MSTSLFFCIFLLSCFDNELTNLKDCPKSCRCFSAPKDGYNWNEDSKSLFCSDIKQLSLAQLKKLEPINTLRVGISDSFKLIDKSDSKLYINNLHLFGSDSSAPVHSILSTIRLNQNALKVFTFINLNLEAFDWQSLSELQSLKAIHIESCELSDLKSNDFGSLYRLISLSIIKSNFNSINSKTFKNWDSLKRLTITETKLRDLSLLQTNLPSLWYLDLSQNQIQSLPADFFTSLPELKVLKLNKNNLAFLNWNILKPAIKQLREFLLEDNELCVSSDVVEIYKELKEVQEYPAFFVNSMMRMICQDVKHYDSGYYPSSNCNGIHETSIDKDPITAKHNCCIWLKSKNPNDYEFCRDH